MAGEHFHSLAAQQHSEGSNVWQDEGICGLSGRARRVRRARDFTVCALKLDPELPEARASRGIIAGLYERNWNEARRRFLY